MSASTGMTPILTIRLGNSILWVNFVSDLLLAVFIVLISLVLLRIFRRRHDIPLRWVLLCCGLFLFSCAAIPASDAIPQGSGAPLVGGLVRVSATLVCLVTLVVLLRWRPVIESMPGQDDLEEANRQLSSLLESDLVGVSSVDADWRILYLNERAKKLLQIKGELAGQNLFEIFPAMSAGTRDRLQQSMRLRRTEEFDSYYEPLNLWTKISAHPWSHGGLTILFTDVSEAKRLEQRLAEEHELRKQQTEELAKIAEVVAREVSTPLGLIQARAADLRERSGPVGAAERRELMEACDSIAATADRTLRTLRGLRGLSRESLQGEMKEVELPPLIEEALDAVYSQFLMRRILLVPELPKETVRIRCRERQIRQVLLVLLNSALDSVEGSPRRDRWVRVMTVAGETSVTIRVEAAVSKEEAGPAQWLLSESDAALQLAKLILREHGGALERMEEPGQICFRMTLPRAS